MLTGARGLTAHDLAAIADLERRCLDVDGGRLKLEWGTLRSRPGREVEDLLWWDGDRLLGFVGLYAFAPPAVELAGMVDPAVRRRGIASHLLDAALPITRARGLGPVLLVVPRSCAAGREFALARRAVLDHSEHALVLTGPPSDRPADDRVALREATPSDRADVARLLSEAFGYTPDDRVPLSAETARTLVVERDGRCVGTMRVTLVDDVGGIYGFAVDAALRGQGIGREALRRACLSLCGAGARTVGLEVRVENEHAIGLYTSVGFAPVSTEDYYRLPTG